MLNIFWRVLKINFKLRGNMHLKYKKILIVGCGGAGKSTLAVMLGQKLKIHEFSYTCCFGYLDG